MVCPQCRAEYGEEFIECPRCHSRDSSADTDLDVLIRTGIADPIAIGLVESLFQEAGMPFFVMDQNVTARQEGGNFFGWWTVRVPRKREAEARKIIRAVEEMK